MWTKIGEVDWHELAMGDEVGSRQWRATCGVSCAPFVPSCPPTTMRIMQCAADLCSCDVRDPATRGLYSWLQQQQ